MISKLILCCSLLLVGSFLSFAAVKPDFSGSWSMDRARSFGLPGNMQQSMTVKQSGDQIEVVTKLMQPGNERTVSDTIILDGKEYDYAPPVPPNATADAPKPKGKRTAKWLPAGDGIMVTEVTTAQTPNGEVTTQVVKKWTLNGDGELTIASFVDTPTISYEAKRIFRKG
jgi:hypothetical protein